MDIFIILLRMGRYYQPDDEAETAGDRQGRGLCRSGEGRGAPHHAGVADAPRPDEIVVVIGIADGGRVNPRVGKGRIL